MKNLFLLFAFVSSLILTGCGTSYIYEAENRKTSGEAVKWSAAMSNREKELQADIKALQDENIALVTKKQTIEDGLNSKYAIELQKRADQLNNDIESLTSDNEDYHTQLNQLLSMDSVTYAQRAPDLRRDIKENDSLLIVKRTELYKIEGMQKMPWTYVDSTLYLTKTRVWYLSIMRNDSLIVSYQKQLVDLKRENNNFLAKSALQTTEREMKLKGEALDVAKANYIVTKTEMGANLKFASVAGGTGVDNASQPQFVGLIENQWSRPVIAVVTGPNGYFLQVKIPARSSKTFYFPVSHETVTYKTNFIWDTGTEKGDRPMEAQVGPTIVYNNGLKDYRYMAVLKDK